MLDFRSDFSINSTLWENIIVQIFFLFHETFLASLLNKGIQLITLFFLTLISSLDKICYYVNFHVLFPLIADHNLKPNLQQSDAIRKLHSVLVVAFYQHFILLLVHYNFQLIVHCLICCFALDN